ncbi:MAG: VOC family protein [Solirubrobacterales bacterium]
MPKTMQTLYPCLAYQDADAAISFLQEAFGFAEHALYRDDDDRVAHCELALEGAVVMVGDEGAGSIGLSSPKSLGAVSACIYVAVDDPDALAERVRGTGTELEHDLHETDYGSREFACLDPEGVLWSFGTYRPSVG